MKNELGKSRIIGVVEARMGSTRLPGKVLRPILGVPLLGRLLERMERAKNLSEIVVATTNLPADDPLADWLKKQGVSYYRGDSEDVLKRVVDCSRAFHAKIVVRLTGDNPLLDPGIIDQAIQIYLSGRYDYVCNDFKSTFPKGLDVRVFSTESLACIEAKTHDAKDREHVTSYYYRHPEEFRIFNLEAEEELRHPEYRITVDTQEDFDRVCAIYEALYSNNPRFSSLDIIRHLGQIRHA